MSGRSDWFRSFAIISVDDSKAPEQIVSLTNRLDSREGVGGFAWGRLKSIDSSSPLYCKLRHFAQLRDTCGCLHCTVLIGLEPMIDTPPEVCPVREADVSLHLIPVS